MTTSSSTMNLRDILAKINCQFQGVQLLGFHATRLIAFVHMS